MHLLPSFGSYFCHMTIFPNFSSHKDGFTFDLSELCRGIQRNFWYNKGYCQMSIMKKWLRFGLDRPKDCKVCSLFRCSFANLSCAPVFLLNVLTAFQTHHFSLVFVVNFTSMSSTSLVFAVSLSIVKSDLGVKLLRQFLGKKYFPLSE